MIAYFSRGKEHSVAVGNVVSVRKKILIFLQPTYTSFSGEKKTVFPSLFREGYTQTNGNIDRKIKYVYDIYNYICIHKYIVCYVYM